MKNPVGGPSTTGFVWRSFKKIILSILLVSTLALSVFIKSLDMVWQGKMSFEGAIVQSYTAALAKGFTNFLPKFIQGAEYLIANQPSQFFVLAFIPDVLIFLAIFLWVSVAIDVLDMQKEEVVPFYLVVLITFALLAVFSISAIGFNSAMVLFGK